jgi:hypothetical protein
MLWIAHPDTKLNEMESLPKRGRNILLFDLITHTTTEELFTIKRI